MCVDKYTGARDAIVGQLKIKHPTVKHQHRHDNELCAIGVMTPGANSVSFDFSAIGHDATTNPMKFGEKKIINGNYAVPISARLEFAVVDLAGTTPWQSAPWAEFDEAALVAAGATAAVAAEVAQFVATAGFYQNDQDGNTLISDLDISNTVELDGFVPTNKHPLLTGEYTAPALLVAPAVLTNANVPDPAAEGEVYAFRICYKVLGIKGLCTPLVLNLAERCAQNTICPPCGTTTVDTTASASTNYNVAKHGVLFD